MVIPRFDNNNALTPNHVAQRWSIWNLLPHEATFKLREAALIDPDIPFGESKERAAAVNEAIREVKLQFPNHFRKE